MRKGTRDVRVEGLDMQFHGLALLTEATLELAFGRRYGLVGPNGCGKSTLLRALAAGELPIPPGLDYFALEHEVPSSATTALEAVLAVDSERSRLEREEAALSDQLAGDCDDADEVNERLTAVSQRLEELGAESAEARAAQILSGLGFDRAAQARPCSDFSGGWRMRIALAQVLFMAPSLLILDEPTNHLDLEAVVWLEAYLAAFGNTLLLVSHSQDFMNHVCTNMLHMHNGTLTPYRGNYDTYVKTRAEVDENVAKRHAWEQEEMRKMKDYIARFGHGSAKLARQAQSKEKVLAKMEREGLAEAPRKERLPFFVFPDPERLPPPVISFTDVAFRYPGGPMLYEGLNFGFDQDSRIALVGPNGAGKSTLQKLMARELEPTDGHVSARIGLSMGRYTQHFVDTLDLTISPIAYLQRCYPDMRDVERVRQFLGRFGLSGVHQMQVIGALSDGQKARVVFAWMALKGPHIILLDEPTNHLDMESIDALASALNTFTGGVVLVSHDMRLIEQVAKEIWIVDRRSVTPYPGDIRQYKAEVAARIAGLTDARTKAVIRATGR